MTGRAVLADPPPDLGYQLIGQLLPLAQDDEHRHPAVRPLPGYVDDERVEHLREREHRPVDLARPHPDPASVDGGVRAPVDHRGSPVGDHDPVAVPPDPGVSVEVALAVARSVVVAPEADRHRRHRLGDHELAHLVRERVALGIPRLDSGPERASLKLAEIHRQGGHAADEGSTDIGSAGGREQPSLGPQLLIDPVEALGRQRRAGRADAA